MSVRKRPITPKLYKAELQYIYTALLLYEIYLPTKLMYLVVSELCPVYPQKLPSGRGIKRKIL